MIATSKDQSRRLLSMGLDQSTADMEYCYIDEYNSGLQVKSEENTEVDNRLDQLFGVTHIPAWSLSALLEVMPKYITDNGVEYKIEIWTDGLAAPKWVIGYSGKSYSGHYFIQRIITIIHRTIGDDLLTAAYEMVCWMLEKGYIKKGGNDE